jgi:hypothetical protein
MSGHKLTEPQRSCLAHIASRPNGLTLVSLRGEAAFSFYVAAKCTVLALKRHGYLTLTHSVLSDYYAEITDKGRRALAAGERQNP